MFTKKDFSIIDRRYFRVIQTTCYYITLQSKNTGHFWHIESYEGRGWNTCRIFHSHHGDSYHPQFSMANLHKVQQRIKSHDQYHLEVRLAENARRREGRVRSQLFTLPLE